MPSALPAPAHTLITVVNHLLKTGEITAPCAVVDVAAFDSNAQKMTARTQGLPIRVASKSLRSTHALRRALSHPGYQGILSFTLPESINLVREGFTDIVCAYPSVNVPAIREIAHDDDLRRNITLMVDSVELLDLIRSAIRDSADTSNFTQPGAPEDQALRVAIDLDCTLHLPGAVIGPRRSPIRTPEQTRALAQEITSRPELKLVGLMAYEGQVASVPDGESGIVGSVKRWLRSTSMEQLGPRRKACIEAAREFADLEFVNGGGTGSLDVSAAEGTLTELAAGSGFYTPVIFDNFADINHKPSAYFVCQVSRLPAEGWATVNSGGWIASGPAGQDRLPVPVYPAGLGYSTTEGPGEVQTPLHGHATKSLTVGDAVWFRHAKAGEMTENVDSIVAVNPDGTYEIWDTYRGKGWTCR
ncbi:alanine racemase [Corynebacterium aquatimens]|uniref:D-serine deaminase-like pyridoxal phosphate-dependent protein n=1 Tax=Corynebacterium aquatimens TaxID=1190508 RepID=A0A931GTW5_9CORY|nr:alanine racemase [Corynebacterium aquatimens]MBG6122205.1 D-serine deaminase-like pyridoxal phosphate-dependent protein [Corynebacterium aquatimens]WJY65254.1 3-hydroxy-D-aspartate aldolase [Corynebacterium aquatimens]